MINHRTLPPELVDKIIKKDINIEKFFFRYTNGNPHDVIKIDDDYILTEFGIEWFNSIGLTERDSHLFRLAPSFVANVHEDDANADFCSFNYVVEGHADMQWVEMEKFERYIETHWSADKITRSDVPRYRGIEGLTVIDSWMPKQGEMGLVRIDVPHRVVNLLDVPRYAATIRPKGAMKKHFKFDDVITRF